MCGRFTQHLSWEELHALAELVGQHGGEHLGAIVVCRQSNCAQKRKGGLRRARLKLATDATAWKRRPLLDARSECGSCLAEPGLRLFAAIFLNCCCEPRPSSAEASNCCSARATRASAAQCRNYWRGAYSPKRIWRVLKGRFLRRIREPMRLF